MSVYKPKNTPFYQYDFEYDGHRFYGSTKARSKTDALKVEKGLYDKAVEDAKERKKLGAKGPRTLRFVSGQYWDKVGQYHSGAADTFRDIERLCAYFGPDKQMTEIGDNDVADLVAWRRKHTIKGKEKRKDGTPMPTIANATVNRSTTEVLKKLFTFAKDTWKLPFPNEPKWGQHWLAEPEERVRELHGSEGEAIDRSVRDDYAPWLDFVHETALRLDETLLKWEHVNWGTRQIVRFGKGGQRVVTPITPTIRSILWPLRGHHPVWVFTYICKRADKARERLKGRRYPITYEGAKTQWRRTLARSGVKDFRLHDMRHDTASKLLRSTGNLKLVQKALNHKRITTTARYAHVLDQDVSEALERVSKSRKKSRTTLKKIG